MPAVYIVMHSMPDHHSIMKYLFNPSVFFCDIADNVWGNALKLSSNPPIMPNNSSMKIIPDLKVFPVIANSFFKPFFLTGNMP